MSGEALIALRGVSHAFRDGAVAALSDVSFEVRAGEFVSIVGPSGCGKTTVLRLINGLLRPDRGDVLVDGVAPRPGPDLAMVFQSPRLLPWRSVAGNIAFALGLSGVPRGERRARTLALLDAVGLAGFADAFPHELSGGMQQRVGLARALGVGPRVLLMDEPFAALDAITRETLRLDLLRLWADNGMAVVFVTHDIDEAILMSQRIVVLTPRPGRVDAIVEVDLPRERWVGDMRGLPEFAALRRQIWERIRNAAATDDRG